MVKKDLIGKLPTKIMLIKEHKGGSPYNTDGFTKGNFYEPIGMYYHDYHDGSSCVVFIVADDEGHIKNVNVEYFSIVLI